MTIHLRSLPASVQRALLTQFKISTPATKARPKKPRLPTAETPRRAVMSYAGEPITISIDLKPRPKQRARHSVQGNRVRTYTPAQTVAHETEIRMAAQAAMSGRTPATYPVAVDVQFTLAGRPDEWPTSQADGDLDNLCKAVMDALNHVVYVDDRVVVMLSTSKRCGPADAIHITIRPAAC